VEAEKVQRAAQLEEVAVLYQAGVHEVEEQVKTEG